MRNKLYVHRISAIGMGTGKGHSRPDRKTAMRTMIYPERLFLRLPAGTRETVDALARAEETTAAEIYRRALRAGLRQLTEGPGAHRVNGKG